MFVLVPMQVNMVLIARMGKRVMLAVVVVALILVTGVVVMVPVTSQCPYGKPYPGQDQNNTDNMALLGLKGAPKLETDQGNDATQNDGREHMSNRRQEAGSGGSDE